MISVANGASRICMSTVAWRAWRPRYAVFLLKHPHQGLVPSAAEERMRYIHAVSQELAQTLRTMDGVLAARVHIVMPGNDPSGDKSKPSSAAVFIKHRPDVDVRPLAPAIKELVAHSVEGLSHEHVLLTWVPAQSLAAPESARAASRAGHAGKPAEQQRLPVALVDERAVVVLTILLAGAVSRLVLPHLMRSLRR